jgi:hypothetical protein
MGNASESGTHHCPNTIRVFLCSIEVRIGQGHTGGRHRKLGEAVQPPSSTLFHVIGGREAGNFARDSGLEHRRIEPGDAAHC